MSSRNVRRFVQAPQGEAAGAGRRLCPEGEAVAGNRPRIVVVGGGFAGLYTVTSLRFAPACVTLIDRRNFHLFQPLLYQVATGGLSPANIAAPLRSVLRRQSNTTVLMGDVVDIDPGRRRVILRECEVAYDILVLCPGSRPSYFGHEQWERYAPGLKTIEDASRIRNHVLSAFEKAESETDPVRLRSLLTFVIVGGGPTGVELAGALAEVARHTLRFDFRRVNPSQAQILLVERAARVLEHYPPKLSQAAVRSLSRLGVAVMTNASITDLEPGMVTVQSGGKVEQIRAGTVLWAAGVVASPLGQVLKRRLSAQLDRRGGVIVRPDLSVPGYPDVFVVGDLAHVLQEGKPLPGLAAVAMQEGRYVARLVRKRLRGRPVPPFHYHDKGDLATIGRAAAVADLRFVRFSGFFAWLVWLFVHLMYLVQFENRLLVLMQWAYNYFTHNRPARLITELPPITELALPTPLTPSEKPQGPSPPAEGSAGAREAQGQAAEDQLTSGSHPRSANPL